ncbi:glycosyltransferase family 2 protein [Rhodopirellula sp. SWK7]|uniref:glycosyltransferase family 2 protein n=1 Tax=Rhodopirellula sp. SWK7 TaxID=595460 RepID=UPI0002BE0010|nr:glycosyltransferase family A protein [Rhodopirellula sp. SWK7]EMI42509.1 glycosyl transferase, group 2 family [Rhodopirellula sp. SWK7]
MSVFSVVVPTCNRPEELAECLRRLASGVQSMPPEMYEVIVTDDGRRSSAEELVSEHFPWARWTKGPAKGPAANRNHGANLATYEWIVFIDDDCLPESQLLTAYQDAIAVTNPTSANAFQGPTLRIGDPPSLLWEAPHNPLGVARISANFAIHRSDLQNVGGFDERFPSAAIEDTEFFARFEKSGRSIMFVPDAIVNHPLRRVGNAAGLARKWEGKAIFSMDVGASPFTVLWRLPWHSLRVIQSRFRKQPWSRDNLYAAMHFVKEWLLVVVNTPRWVRKWKCQPRSTFWTKHVEENGPPPRFGF